MPIFDTLPNFNFQTLQQIILTPNFQNISRNKSQSIAKFYLLHAGKNEKFTRDIKKHLSCK